MMLGKDNYIIDSKGKYIATLLASLYPTEIAVQRAKQAYERANNEKYTVKKRGTRWTP